MLATSRSLLTQRTLAIDPKFAADHGFAPSAKIGVDGRAYAKYGLGLPILELPWVGAALLISKLTGLAEAHSIAVVLSLLNPLLAALTSVIVFWLCRSVGCQSTIAIAAAVGYSLGTVAWPYAGADGTEALQPLCLALALLWLIRYNSGRRAGWLWGAGIALAYAVLTKPTNAVMAPAFAFYLIALCRRQKLSGRGAFLVFIRFAIPLVVCVLFLAWLNWIRFGSIGESGYNPQMFTHPLWSGLYGLLLSPTKGLVFYAPLVLLAPAGLWLMSKKYKAEAATILLLCISYLIINAKFFQWAGGWCWGPRYLAPVLPLLMPPIVWAGSAARPWRYLGVTLFIIGLGINALGVIISEDAYRGTIMHIYLPGPTGTVLVGSLKDPGQMLEIPVAEADVLPEFSSLAGHLWLARVVLDGCECDPETYECGCRSGAFEEDPKFLSPPWIRRHPEAPPAAPYGARIIRPWILHRLYRRMMGERPMSQSRER